MPLKYQADIVIVGGGIAGMVAALELLNFGKKVLILDKGEKENFGAMAKLSFGGMFFVNTNLQRKAGIKDSPEQAFKDWKSVAHFRKDDHFPLQWAESYVYNCTDHVYHWLKNLGIKYFPLVHWVERGLHTPGNSFPRFHMVWGTGKSLTDTLEEKLKNHPKANSHLSILFEHTVKEIVKKDEKAIAVNGFYKAKDFEAFGENIIIAAGGMGGNIEKVKKHWYKPWGEAPKKILNGLHPNIDGSMFDASEKINAKLTHLDLSWHYAAGIHHPKPRFKDEGLSVVPPKSALWLNARGERIGPIPLITAYDTRFLVEQVCKQKEKYSWHLLNMKIALKEFAISGSESNEAFREKSYYKVLKNILFGNKKLVNDMIANCKDFVIAENVEDLVKKMNQVNEDDLVKVENVKEVIGQYDSQIDRGEKYFNDDQLRRIAHTRQYRGDRARTCKFQKIDDKKAYPLIAIRQFIISRKSLGGIQTNLSCKVLDKNNKIIDGLYAIGESAGFGGGGIHGKGALEGTFLGAAVYNARVCAYDIMGKSL